MRADRCAPIEGQKNLSARIVFHWKWVPLQGMRADRCAPIEGQNNSSREECSPSVGPLRGCVPTVALLARDNKTLPERSVHLRWGPFGDACRPLRSYRGTKELSP